jgi:integrase
LASALPRPDARRPQIERQFATRREAERWLTQQRAAVQRGAHVNPTDSERRFRHLVEAWRATWIDLEPKTRAGYEAILRRHLLPRFADVKIGAITPEAIQTFVNGVDRAPNTVRRVYSVLRQVMKLAVERRYLAANPCDPVRLPRPGAVVTSERMFLTAAEVGALAEAIHPHFQVLVYTAAYTGLRAGELGALRRRDIDPLHGTLSVERALKDVSGRLVFGSTKTHKHRRIALPKFLGSMLAEHLTSHCPDNDPDALVFTGLEGGPLRHDNFYARHFRPSVERALPPEKHRLRFHDLRHTCASLLIAAGAHPKAIQTQLGHSSITTTLDIHGHLLPSTTEALAAALDATYASASEPPANVAPLRRTAPVQ